MKNFSLSHYLIELRPIEWLRSYAEAPRITVQGNIEQGDVPMKFGNLQPDAHRPDVHRLQRQLRAGKSAGKNEVVMRLNHRGAPWLVSSMSKTIHR